MLLSAFSNASRTVSRPIIVALLSTEILADGHNSSRTAIVSSITPPNSGCIVGSPLPANVMTSGGVPAATISVSFSRSSLRTVSRELNRGLARLAPSALAVDAVETAQLVVQRQQVDAERQAQPAAANRSENDAVEKNGVHGCG